MLRFVTLNWILLGSAAAGLTLAGLTDRWIIGGSVAAVALCVMALRVSRHRRRALSDRSSADPLPNQTEDWLAPPAPRPPTARRAAADDSLVEQMIAQGREALLLRPQIAANLTDADIAAAQVALDE